MQNKLLTALLHIKKFHLFFWLSVVFFGGLSSAGFAQTAAPDSSSLSARQEPDSLKKKSASGLEGPVKYTAHQITFSVDGRKSFLQGDVKIEYQNMTLDAGKVEIDWNNNTMVATGVADSTDSLGNPVYTGLPVFKEKGEEPIYGTKLEYNFKDQRGKVLVGKTAMEPGHYKGQEIVKIGKNTLLVKDGYFTSCDSIDHPDYYFKADEMRIIMKKRAVAKPIIMYIADIPVFALPFGIFPMERGRRSGLIIPSYGESSYGGRYLRHLGFYWAASQYWDATLLANFYEKTGTAYEGQLRYNKRYSYSGNVDARFAPKDVTTGERRQRWSLNFRHNQTINETTSLNASGAFVSDNSFVRDFSHNLQDRLDQVLTTNATLSKRWPGAKNSLTVNVNRTQNLINNELDYTLPQLSFSHTQSSFFSYNSQSGGKRHWYHDITYNYNSNFVSRGSRNLQADSSFLKTTSTGWQHTANLSFNSKIFKYLKYNQSANFQELWVPQYRDYSFVDSLNRAVADTVKGFRARHTFSTSIGASATIYGLFELPFSPLKVIRHKMDPSISFSYSPDFTNPEFGYVQTFRDTSGRIQKYDHFAGNPYGGTSSAEARRMNVSINNLFQGKIIRDGEEKKIDLFTWNLNSSYDFLRDSLKWSPITSSLRAKASKDFDFALSATHSFYKSGPGGRGDRNEYFWQDGFGLPRLVRANLSVRWHLAPPEKKKEKKPGEAEAEADTTAASETENQYSITTEPIQEGLKKFKLPWDLTTNFSYTIDRQDINNVRKLFSAQVAARIEITPKWRIQYSANIDLINKQIDYQSFNIYRDLHCWEMSFAWAPNPQGYSFFTFEIRVKASALKDIKLTKSSAGRRVY